ncbi:Protein of unknown function, partial [Gryllus bimaculatus]
SVGAGLRGARALAASGAAPQSAGRRRRECTPWGLEGARDAQFHLSGLRCCQAAFAAGARESIKQAIVQLTLLVGMFRIKESGGDNTDIVDRNIEKYYFRALESRIHHYAIATKGLIAGEKGLYQPCLFFLIEYILINPSILDVEIILRKFILKSEKLLAMTRRKVSLMFITFGIIVHLII